MGDLCGAAKGELVRPYAKVPADDERPALAKAISIIHEEIPEERLRQARAWLGAAHTICFLGFGFHPFNLARLGMKDHPYRDATIWGTTVGLTEIEENRVRERFMDGRAIRLAALDSRRFLRERAVLQTQ
jgi:hypothetical protein